MTDALSTPEFPVSRINLRGLLVYDNPSIKRYRDAVSRVEKQEFWPSTNPSFCDTEMTWLARPENKTLLDYLKQHLNGTIVDLASGTNSLSLRLNELGINYTEILGVDPWTYKAYLEGEGHTAETRQVDSDTGEVIDPEKTLREPKLYEIRQDALLFTARLKRNSVNFAVFGPTVMNYPWKELCQEIVAAAKKGGIIFGGGGGVIGSKFLELAQNFPSQIKKIGKTNLNLSVFKKVD